MARRPTGRRRGRPARDPDEWLSGSKVQVYFDAGMNSDIRAVAEYEDEGVMARAVRRLCREALAAREGGA